MAIQASRAASNGCEEEVLSDRLLAHSPSLQATSCVQTPHFGDCSRLPPASPQVRSHTRMHDSPLSAVTPECHVRMYFTPTATVTPDHHAQINFTPPPAPGMFGQTAELEEDVKAALALRSLPLLSWALRPYSCHCGIDHSVHAAISYQQPEALMYLLDSSTMNHLVHLPCWGQTPLHKAISMTHADGDVGFTMSNMLLSRGANVDATDAEGEAPIHNACRTCSLPAVQLLLQHGADANLLTSSGFTPLHLLCQRGSYAAEDLSILEELLAHGAAPALLDAYGLRPYDHINIPDISGNADPFKIIMRNILVIAEQQGVREKRWCARRSCLFLRSRPESRHLVCNLPAGLFRAVVQFL